MGSSINSSSLSDASDEYGLEVNGSLGFVTEGSAEVKIPVPYAPDLRGVDGRSRVGRSAAFRIVGLEFCISEAMVPF